MIEQGAPDLFPDISPLRIVIVDDLSFSRTMTKSLLTAAGAGRVETASTIEEGWQLVLQLRPHLLILDWQLEDQSGLELLHLIRQSAASPNSYLPVLMVTAYREEQRVHNAIAAGVTSYLVKPFTTVELLQKVKFCAQDRRPYERGPGVLRPALDNANFGIVDLD